MNTNFILSEIGVSTIASTAVATSVDASALLTALISFGIAIITLVGGELIKYLVAFWKKKTQDLNAGEDKNDRTQS